MSDDKIEVVDERGVWHYLEADAHRALVAVGLVWRVGDGWRMRTESGDLGPYPELAICDFCDARPVVWAIEAAAFRIVAQTVDRVAPSVTQTEVFTAGAGWTACDPCGRLVQAGDAPGLLARALEDGSRSASSRAAVTLLHAGFWRTFRSMRRYDTPYAEGAADAGSS